MPNIVIADEEDRLARLEAHRAAQVVASERRAIEQQEQMKRKMATARRLQAVQRPEAMPVGLVVPVPVVSEPSEPMTQADLIALSQQHPDSSKITRRLEALHAAYDSDTDEDYL